MHLARGSATSTTDGDRDNDDEDNDEEGGRGRRVQFLEPLFTNRITAMHRDQKLLVCNGVTEERPNDVCRLPALSLGAKCSSLRINVPTNFGLPSRRSCCHVLDVCTTKNNKRLVYKRETTDARKSYGSRDRPMLICRHINISNSRYCTYINVPLVQYFR